MGRQGRIRLPLTMVFALAGCASVIPDALRQQAERLPFEALKAQPEDAVRGVREKWEKILYGGNER